MATLRFAFDVRCAPEHAFDVWAHRIDSWWPRDHTVGPAETVLLRPTLGGRIYERDAAGVEHDWGVVTAWEPPTRLAYTWHLGRDPDQATDVEIRFVAAEPGTTRVEVEHRGFDRFGDQADVWRARNRVGWDALVPPFSRAVERSA
jgi:uncharacterized protein YndB with AHSA1/START domain